MNPKKQELGSSISAIAAQLPPAGRNWGRSPIHLPNISPRRVLFSKNFPHWGTSEGSVLLGLTFLNPHSNHLHQVTS
jgi:hypothetical protein